VTRTRLFSRNPQQTRPHLRPQQTRPHLRPQQTRPHLRPQQTRPHLRPQAAPAAAADQAAPAAAADQAAPAAAADQAAATKSSSKKNKKKKKNKKNKKNRKPTCNNGSNGGDNFFAVLAEDLKTHEQEDKTAVAGLQAALKEAQENLETSVPAEHVNDALQRINVAINSSTDDLKPGNTSAQKVITRLEKTTKTIIIKMRRMKRRITDLEAAVDRLQTAMLCFAQPAVVAAHPKKHARRCNDQTGKDILAVVDKTVAYLQSATTTYQRWRKILVDAVIIVDTVMLTHVAELLHQVLASTRHFLRALQNDLFQKSTACGDDDDDDALDHELTPGDVREAWARTLRDIWESDTFTHAQRTAHRGTRFLHYLPDIIATNLATAVNTQSLDTVMTFISTRLCLTGGRDITIINADLANTNYNILRTIKWWTTGMDDAAAQAVQVVMFKFLRLGILCSSILGPAMKAKNVNLEVDMGAITAKLRAAAKDNGDDDSADAFAVMEKAVNDDLTNADPESMEAAMSAVAVAAKLAGADNATMCKALREEVVSTSAVDSKQECKTIESVSDNDVTKGTVSTEDMTDYCKSTGHSLQITCNLCLEQRESWSKYAQSMSAAENVDVTVASNGPGSVHAGPADFTRLAALGDAPSIDATKPLLNTSFEKEFVEGVCGAVHETTQDTGQQLMKVVAGTSVDLVALDPSHPARRLRQCKDSALATTVGIIATGAVPLSQCKVMFDKTLRKVIRADAPTETEKMCRVLGGKLQPVSRAEICRILRQAQQCADADTADTGGGIGNGGGSGGGGSKANCPADATCAGSQLPAKQNNDDDDDDDDDDDVDSLL
jgi:hypothetical protein